MASDSTDSDKNKFLICHQLLSKWQNELEYYLYYFCKITAPQLLDESGWCCVEAAELTRLTEKITEHFCFHHKRTFSSHGISEQERESFCVRLQEVRQIRNLAVHRVTLHTSTIQRYARIVQGILGPLKRIGGGEFSKSCNDRMNRFIETLWDTENNKSRDIELSTIVETNAIRGIESLSRSEQKRLNIERAIEEQKLAAQRQAVNTSRMAEDFQISKRIKIMRIRQIQQDKENSEVRKKERFDKDRKQQEDANLRRAERAEKVRKQQEDANLRRAERAEKVRKQQEDANLRRAERAEKARKQQESAELRKVQIAEKLKKAEATMGSHG
ncbi:hypothetical protein BGW36DRAFT_207485 [Talaromyces proteolyticus]|uniref:Uncharacterized protein n=1 Tax=Talaromyces proteolyticus TaxID=1131652 RepID=A0AAD4PY17_9EURO|nr:uncharacterized protein BGW36DRAFT_207485 [Talaromyces proteolyticus]KAH8693581.1 hypothetical protein BGW36DRAFT_207485 [Talaromyces proteolyticus]